MVVVYLNHSFILSLYVKVCISFTVFLKIFIVDEIFICRFLFLDEQDIKKKDCPYSLRNPRSLITNCKSIEKYGIDWIVYKDPQIRQTLHTDLRNSELLSIFKCNIKKLQDINGYGYLSNADLVDVETDSADGMDLADSAVSANPTDSFNSTDSYFNPYLDSLGLFLKCGLLLLLLLVAFSRLTINCRNIYTVFV